MSAPKPKLSQGAMLRLAYAASLHEGQVIFLGSNGFVGTKAISTEPVVKARKITSIRWQAGYEGEIDAPLRIEWEGDENSWVICRPNALFVVCEQPEGA